MWCSKILTLASSGVKKSLSSEKRRGKSTLTRILAGKEDYEGSLTIGYNVCTGFFSQNVADLLDSNDTVFDVIDKAATGDMRTKVRSLLGAFLFSGDSVYKKVKVLSEAKSHALH